MPAIVSQTAIRRGLAAYIARGLPTVAMVIKGAPLPNLDTLEEWMQFDWLSDMPAPQRAATVRRSYFAQLIMFSRYAHRRGDKKIDRPWELADQANTIISGANLTVTENGNTSCVRLFEPKQIYLDLQSSGEFSKQIYLQSTPTETHCVVLLFELQQVDSIAS